MDNIIMDRYMIEEWLGDGAHATVDMATDLRTKQTVALKKIRLEEKKIDRDMLRESLILYELQHKNIVRLEGVFVHEGFLYLVLEHMTMSMNVHFVWHKDKYNDLGMIKGFLKQILCGISYCHSHGVLHRDLKPENLLITDDELKIADFGSARGFLTVETSLTPTVVTVDYRAPEILLGSERYSTAIDMWSIGCVFAEMMTLKPLFKGESEIDVLHKIFSTMGTPNEDNWPGVTSLENFPNGFSVYNPKDLGTLVLRLDANGKDLLSKLLCLDPSRRISAEEALEHEYLKN